MLDIYSSTVVHTCSVINMIVGSIAFFGGDILIFSYFQKDLCIEEFESSIMNYRYGATSQLTGWPCYLSFPLVWSIQTHVHMWFQNVREDKNNLGQEVEHLQHKLIMWVERPSLCSFWASTLGGWSSEPWAGPPPITALYVVVPVSFSTRTLGELSKAPPFWWVGPTQPNTQGLGVFFQWF